MRHQRTFSKSSKSSFKLDEVIENQNQDLESSLLVKQPQRTTLKKIKYSKSAIIKYYFTEIMDLIKTSLPNISSILATVPIYIFSVFFLSHKNPDNISILAVYGIGISCMESLGVALLISLNTGLFVQASHVLGNIESFLTQKNDILEKIENLTNIKKNNEKQEQQVDFQKIEEQQKQINQKQEEEELNLTLQDVDQNLNNNYNLTNVLLFRGILVGILHMILLFIIFYHLDILLLSIHISEHIAIQTRIFCLSILPSLVFQTLWDIQRQFMLANQDFNTPNVIINTTYLISPLFVYIFIYVLDMKLYGVAMAKTITDLIVLIGITYCGQTNQLYKNTLQNLQLEIRNVITGFLKYFSNTCSIAVLMYFEWLFFEVMIMLVGSLQDEKALSGFTTFNSIIFLFFGVPVGIQWTVNSILGGYIGQGDLKRSKYFIKTALLGTFFVAVLFCLLGNLTLQYFTEYLISESQPTVREQFQICYQLYVNLVFIPDSMQAVSSAVLKACGQERYAAISYFVIYYIFGIPLAYLLIFGVGLGMPGAWITTSIVNLCICAVLLRKIFSLDVENSIEDISERLSVTLNEYRISNEDTKFEYELQTIAQH